MNRVPPPDTKWWQNTVVYQVYPRSFQDSNGDGIGDLQGVIKRVDYLAKLGVGAVWLSPIYQSPQADNGYDISDYRAIDPTFGTLADLEELTAELHRRDIKLVMDLVVNHTSDRHDWFQRSCAGDPEYADWYWWRPPREGFKPGQLGAEPTNWESFFSGPTWSYRDDREQYYLHLFTEQQPDLNWEHPPVRQAIYDMMNWWLDRDIDGFRMDVINLISKDTSLPDGFVSPGKRYGNGFPHYACGPKMHTYLQEMRRQVFAGRDRTYLTIGEMPGVDVEHAQKATDPDRGELDMVFQFEHVETDHAPGNKWERIGAQPDALADVLTRWQEGLAGVGWNSLYLANHDHPRPTSRFGDPDRHWFESATALATMVHLLAGTPFVYQGEELGMPNGRFSSINDFRDVETRNRYRELVEAGASPDAAFEAVRHSSRDHARTPLIWDMTASGGFSEGTPWIAATPTPAERTASGQVADEGSVFHYYRRLIELRRSEPVIVHGSFERLADWPDGTLSYRRTLGADQLDVQVNLTAETKRKPISCRADGHVLITNYQVPGDGVALRPWEAVARLHTGT